MKPEFTEWVLGIVAVLLAVGVGSLVRLAINFSALQTTVQNWSKTFEDRFVVIADTSAEHTKEIGGLHTRVSVHEVRINQLDRVVQPPPPSPDRKFTTVPNESE